MTKYHHSRILLKISGEALAGDGKFAHDLGKVKQLCSEIKTISDEGVEMCVVVGGGNILRGVTASENGLERTTADYMGKLATVINALLLQASFESIGAHARVVSAIDMATICEHYNRRRSLQHLGKGRIVIFAAGTGNPLFSTDTAAALRAIEMNCQLLLKATQVDGVYSADPKKDATAKKYLEISYQEVLAKELQVMDISAIALAKEHKLPIIVFSMQKQGDLDLALRGEGSFTIIK